MMFFLRNSTSVSLYVIPIILCTCISCNPFPVLGARFVKVGQFLIMMETFLAWILFSVPKEPYSCQTTDFMKRCFVSVHPWKRLDFLRKSGMSCIFPMRHLLPPIPFPSLRDLMSFFMPNNLRDLLLNHKLLFHLYRDFFCPISTCHSCHVLD